MSKQRALVCGASQGIGKAIAIELATRGFQLTLFARTEKKLASLVSLLPGEGHDFVAGEIGQPASWRPQLEEKHQHQAYTVLILNTGGPPAGPISQASMEDFLAVTRNHVGANAELVALCLPAMKVNKWGRIVTLTSTSVKMPIPHLGVSNTARAAVASWAKTLSFELAPLGITVNNIMPGFTDTPRLSQLIEAQAAATGRSPAEVRTEWMKTIPAGRFCRPEETASLAAFLVSEDAAMITGQSIAVDGGRLGCL